MPDLARARRVIFFLEEIEHGERGGAGYRVAAIGASQCAGRRRVHDVGAPNHAAQGHTRRQRLGDNHQVGLNPVMIDGKHAARAAEARLNLVGHEQDIMLLAERFEGA